jgi:arsenate reductase-like glutaredoxin family protein
MFNFRSPSFKKTGMDRNNLDDSDLIELMLREPRLIRRPLVRIRDGIFFGADSKALAELLK